LLERGDWFPNDRVRLAEVISTLGLTAYLLFGLRCVELNRWPLASPRLPFRRTPSGPAPRTPRLRLRPLSGALLRITLAPVAAFFLLWLAPWESMYPNSPRLVPSVYRAILFLWGLGVMAIILGTTCSILGWRRLSGSQAALYSRWLVANEMAREQRSVERARAARLRQR
jgi:hypothetical protein